MWLLHKELLSWSNCVIACIIVKIYTCVTVAIGPPSYPTNWNKCFAIEPYFKTRFDTVQICILECRLRRKCMGVNFCQLTNVCEMLDDVDLANLTLNKAKKPCVSMLKTEMSEIPSCPACSGNLVCDLTTNSCIGKECSRLGPVENGHIFGNTQVDKAKAKLKCDSHFLPQPISGNLVCQAGNRSPSNPRCIPTNGCNGNWARFGMNCYIPVEIPMSWTNARAHCQANNADLVDVHSAEENAFVSGYLAVSWIGLTDAAEEGTFVWSSGKRVNYTVFSQGEPNDSGGNEDCVTIYATHNQWNDYSCIHQLKFLCEKPSA